jgi:hypothetical protein
MLHCIAEEDGTEIFFVTKVGLRVREGDDVRMLVLQWGMQVSMHIC